MSTVWFTSDTHFGHAKVIEYCQRPFADVEAMNRQLVTNWNSVVDKDDIVYFLGDFSFARPAPFFQQLNGHIALVLGNHDESQKSRLKVLPFMSISKSLWVIVDGKLVYMSHHPGEAVTGYDLYLHGHCHGELLDGPNRCDVGVDCWGFRPVTLDRIIDRLEDATLTP